MTSDQEHVIESNLPLDVYVRVKGHPTGDCMLHGSTPGRIQIPSGHVPIACPTAITNGWEPYAELWQKCGLDAVYLKRVRDAALVAKFLSTAGHIRHVVAEDCGWSMQWLDACPALEWLEVRSSIQISNLHRISELGSLQGLIVTSCNNVFSSGIPKHDALVMLVVRNVASLQNCHELVMNAACHFPNLQEFRLNGVQYPGDDLDLSPLQQLGHPVRLQAVGTRVTDESGQYAAYCRERGQIDGYIESLNESVTEVTLEWAAVHRNDLAVLAEDGKRLEAITLKGCCDLASLDELVEFPGLSILCMENCRSIPSVNSLAYIQSLQDLAIRGCAAVVDYLCLSSCRSLRRLAITGGAGRALTWPEYARQMAALAVELPSGCEFTCDVPDSELAAILEEIPQYREALRRELAHIGTQASRGVNDAN